MRSIGIDLGTTNSVCAFINDDGHPEIIPSSDGGRFTPSVFTVTEDSTQLVGKAAINEETSNPTRTVRSIKRKMGTSERLNINGKMLSPEEISSYILSKIKSDAESYLGEVVTQAVITVPAYFNNDQRQSTKTAGEIAGLKVLRIINEPTAASLAYGLDKKKNETILVFDLGGGTFDVTILQISSDGLFEVKSTSGDTHLGGDDFDNAIIDMIIEKIKKLEPASEDIDVFNCHYFNFNEDAKVRIREASEQAKIRLSSVPETTVKIKYLGMINTDNTSLSLDVELKITRDDFEKAIEGCIVKIKACVDNALKDAKLKPENIDEIIFVGGSTRVPIVAQKMEEWMGKKPKRSVNPDEAVALGAAIQAGMLSGERKKDILLLDVIPLSLGIETLGGVMTQMISRNTTIPVEYKDIFSTAEDNQEKVTIRVYQGERPQAKNNKFLSDFELTDILPAPRGIPQIQVIFDVDANGILSVRAVDLATDKEQTVIISGSSSLTGDEIQQIIQDAEQNATEDIMFKEIHDLTDKLRQASIQIESMLRESSFDLTKEIIEELENKHNEIEKVWSSGEDYDTEKLSDILTTVQQIISVASEIIYKKADEIIMGE